MRVRSECFTSAENWTPPTVEEVAVLWSEAAEKYGIEISKLHKVIGIGERAARRWRSKADAISGGKSIISYGYFVVLVAMARNEVILGIVKYDPKVVNALQLPSLSGYLDSIQRETSSCYFNLIDKILMMDKYQFAHLIRVNERTISRYSNRPHCSPLLYCLIMLAIGVSPEKLFKNAKYI